MSEIKLSLIENAENFLTHSLSEAIVAEKSSQNWKYAILHLVQSIELSLKELVKKEHSILIYKNVDSPKETISLEYAVKRLQNIAGINFKSDDLETISLASDIRNEIVHYEFSFKEEEIKPIYAKLLGFLQSIFNTYFNKNLSNIVDDKTWDEAVKILEYTNELWKRAKEKFQREGISNSLIIECKKCYQESFVFQDDINTCFVCGNIDDVAQCASCRGFFYLDELRGLHEFDEYLYCQRCIEHMYLDYYPRFY